MRGRYTFLVLITLAHLFGFSTSAKGEQIPVLVWERGQVQNVVLGQGDQGTNWNLYLSSKSGRTIAASKSNVNQDGFFVFSIRIPTNFELGGYVLEAKNDVGEIKQVGAVQVIQQTSKEITRVPFELFLILFGFSIWLFIFNRISGQTIHVISNFKNSESHFPSKILDKIKIYIDDNSKSSLIRKLSIDGLNLDSHFPKSTLFSTVIGIVVLSGSQFVTGNWITSNQLLILLCILIAAVFTLASILFSCISLIYLLTNIAVAKSLAEIFSFFILSFVFITPSLATSLLLKFLTVSTDMSTYRFWQSIFFSAFLGSLTSFQLLLLYESLSPTIGPDQFFKEILFIILFLVLAVKNYVICKKVSQNEVFNIVRAIGPMWTFLISISAATIIYIWTLNLMIATVSFFSLLLILSSNWLRFSKFQTKKLPKLEFKFGLLLIFVVMVAIYLVTQVLPQDVITNSNLAILLIFPLDFAIALYLWISRVSDLEESSR